MKHFVFFFFILFLCKTSCATIAAIAPKAPIDVPSAVYFNQPNLTDEELEVWLKTTLLSVFTFDSANYRYVINDNRYAFTNEGFKQFLKALNHMQTLDRVERDLLSVTPLLKDKPVITNEVIVNYHYTWEVKATLILSFHNQSQAYRQIYDIECTIVRVPPSLSGMGVAIDAFKVIVA